MKLQSGLMQIQGLCIWKNSLSMKCSKNNNKIKISWFLIHRNQIRLPKYTELDPPPPPTWIIEACFFIASLRTCSKFKALSSPNYWLILLTALTAPTSLPVHHYVFGRDSPHTHTVINKSLEITLPILSSTSAWVVPPRLCLTGPRRPLERAPLTCRTSAPVCSTSCHSQFAAYHFSSRWCDLPIAASTLRITVYTEIFISLYLEHLRLNYLYIADDLVVYPTDHRDRCSRARFALILWDYKLYVLYIERGFYSSTCFSNSMIDF